MSRLRKRMLAVMLVTVAALGLSAAVVYANGKHHGPNHPSKHHHHGDRQGFPPSVTRFDLSGYVLKPLFSFAGAGVKVQGVPTEGPFVGQTFPQENYVALPVGHKMLYVAWLDPSTHAIVDAFVMNFKTGVVFDYAPDDADKPESSGTVRIVTRGANRIP